MLTRNEKRNPEKVNKPDHTMTMSTAVPTRSFNGGNTRMNAEDDYDAVRRGEHTSRAETRLDEEAGSGVGDDAWLAAQADGSVAIKHGEAGQFHAAPRAQDNAIDQLRKNRMAQLKSKAASKQSWLALGHGKYVELESEAAFLQASASGLHVRLVCGVVAESSLDGQLLGAHMAALAAVHLETYFCWLRAETAPMMMEMVDFARLPALLLCSEGKVVHQLYGIDRSFTTEGVAQALGEQKMLEFEAGAAYGAQKGGCTSASAARADAHRSWLQKHRDDGDLSEESDELSE